MNDKKLTRELEEFIQGYETNGWVPVEVDEDPQRCQSCGAHIKPDWDRCGTCGFVPLSDSKAKVQELANLVVVQGDMAGEVFRLRFEVHVIGRGEEADIVVSDPEISRRHARLKRHENHYIIEDLRSANGTWINDLLLIERRLLMPGDRLRIGQTEFIVRYTPPAAK